MVLVLLLLLGCRNHGGSRWQHGKFQGKEGKSTRFGRDLVKRERGSDLGQKGEGTLEVAGEYNVPGKGRGEDLWCKINKPGG
mgnify:CR=1 FL=1